MMTGDDPLAAFIDAACVPLETSHASGTLERANDLLAAAPDLARRSVHAAAILGDADEVRRFLAADPAHATITGGPRGWNALTHLCFSRYLRLDPVRSGGFVRAATLLLDAGASASSGWMETTHQPEPEWESALYGACGVAHHPGLTQLLLEHGADPNAITRWGKTALHNAILSDNDLAIVELLLDHRANPLAIATRPERGSPRRGHRTAVEMAARRGRGDVIEAFERRGTPIALVGLDALLSACASHDEAAARVIAAREPTAVDELVASGGMFLAAFAGVGNTEGCRLLLDLGVAVDAPFAEGEGYFDVAPGSLAIHVAAWRAAHDTLRLLIARGSPIDVRDGKGRTPLTLAVRACVDSYWAGRRTTESVRALLDAGASKAGVAIPSGYAEADALLARETPG